MIDRYTLPLLTRTHTHTHTHTHYIYIYTQCVWLILLRKFSSTPAGGKLRVWRQASRAEGGVFTEVNWLKLRYIFHIMIWYSSCSRKMLIWGQFLHYLLSLTSNYISEVYDCNLVAVIHEMTEFYRVLISVILLPLLQRLYTPLSAVLNISETCVYLRVT